MSEMQVKNIDVNGVNYAYIEMGEGPLVLCLHGFPDNAYSFTSQLREFSALGYRVVAPFMRGYAPTGFSPDGKYYTSQLGADVVSLITLLGYEKAVVIGHDYGAGAAYAAALTAPERIAALVACSVPHGVELATAIVTNAEQQRRSWYIFFFQLPFAEMGVSFNDFAFIDRLWSDWSPGWKWPSATLASVKKTLAEPGVLGAALGYYRTAFGAPPTDPALAQVQPKTFDGSIGVPCLYIHGAKDGCIGVELTEGVHKYFTGPFERVVVEGAGHFVHMEQPAAFNAAVKGFLARTFPG